MSFLYLLKQFFLLTVVFYSVQASGEIGVPGTECIFGGICSGGAVCIDILCLCVDGHRELDGKCVDSSIYDSFIKEEHYGTTLSSKVPSIGLAGNPCGQGGVCRPSTKCIEGFCKCRQGYNASFGECVRDLSIPRTIARIFVPDSRSVLRFPS